MNYLELCNEVLIRMREDEITDINGADNEPQQKLVTRFVQDAYDFVLKSHTWNGNRKVWTIPVVEGQDTYPLPISTEAASLYSVELKQGCDKIADLREVSHPYIAVRDECNEGTPMYYAPAHVVDGKLGVQVWPMPVKDVSGGDGDGGGSEPEPEPEPPPVIPPECGGHSCTDYSELYPPEAQTIGVTMADATGDVWKTITDTDGSTRLTTLDGGASNVWGTGTRLDLASFANRESDNVFCKNYAYVGGADGAGTTIVLESGGNALAQGWVTGDIEGINWVQSSSFVGEIPSQKVYEVWECAVYLDFNDPQYGSDSYIEISPKLNTQWKTSSSVFNNPYVQPKYAINGTTGTITATYAQSTYQPDQAIAAGVGPDKMTGWYYFKVEASMYLDNDTEGAYSEARDFDATFTLTSPIGTIVRTTVGTPPPAVGLGAIGNLYTNVPSLYLLANQQYGTQQTRIIGLKNGTIDDEALVFARMQRNYEDPEGCPIIDPPAYDPTDECTGPDCEAIANYVFLYGNSSDADDVAKTYYELPDTPMTPDYFIKNWVGEAGRFIFSGTNWTDSETPTRLNLRGEHAINDTAFVCSPLKSISGDYPGGLSQYSGVIDSTIKGDGRDDYRAENNLPELYTNEPEASLDTGEVNIDVEYRFAIYHVVTNVSQVINFSPSTWTVHVLNGGSNPMKNLGYPEISLDFPGRRFGYKNPNNANETVYDFIGSVTPEKATGWYFYEVKWSYTGESGFPCGVEPNGFNNHVNRSYTIKTPFGFQKTVVHDQESQCTAGGVSSQFADEDNVDGYPNSANGYYNRPKYGNPQMPTQGFYSLAVATQLDKLEATGFMKSFAKNAPLFEAPESCLAQANTFNATKEDTGDNTGDNTDPDAPVLTGDELVVHGYGMAPKLALATDDCEIPTQPVLYYALALASRERGEVGGQSSQELFGLAKSYLSDAISWDVNNARDEYTWRQV